jgi:hypothetical protein
VCATLQDVLQDDDVRVFQALTGDKAHIAIPSSATDATKVLGWKSALSAEKQHHNDLLGDSWGTAAWAAGTEAKITAVLQRAVLDLPSLSHLLPEDVFLADDDTTVLVRPMISVRLTGVFEGASAELKLTTEHGLTLNATEPATVNYVLKKVAGATGIDARLVKVSVMHGATKITPEGTDTVGGACIASGTVLLVEEISPWCDSRPECSIM